MLQIGNQRNNESKGATIWGQAYCGVFLVGTACLFPKFLGRDHEREKNHREEHVFWFLRRSVERKWW